MREQEFGSWFVDRRNISTLSGIPPTGAESPLWSPNPPTPQSPFIVNAIYALHWALGLLRNEKKKKNRSSLGNENFHTKHKILSAYGLSMQKAMATRN